MWPLHTSHWSLHRLCDSLQVVCVSPAGHDLMECVTAEAARIGGESCDRRWPVGSLEWPLAHSMDLLAFEDVCDEHTEAIKNNSVAANTSNADTIIHPPGCVSNKKLVSRLPKIQDFVVYPDDTWVVTFPKCGTTWTQELVWLLKNDLDFEKAKSTILRTRFPFLELEPIMDKIVDGDVFPDTIELAASTKRPRCIKSHLPPELLPKQIWTVKPKVIYVSRNPRDAVVSYYHHHRLWNGYKGSFESFFEAFIADRVMYAPYWNHFKSYMKLRDSDHILINSFEEMKKDLAKVVRKTAAFLDVSVTDEQVGQLCDHLSFANMKNNDSVNYMDVGKEILKQTKMDPNLNFMRSGESGGWKKVLTQPMLEKMDDWTKTHLAGTEYDDYPF